MTKNIIFLIFKVDPLGNLLNIFFLNMANSIIMISSSYSVSFKGLRQCVFQLKPLKILFKLVYSK